MFFQSVPYSRTHSQSAKCENTLRSVDRVQVHMRTTCQLSVACCIHEMAPALTLEALSPSKSLKAFQRVGFFLRAPSPRIAWQETFQSRGLGHRGCSGWVLVIWWRGVFEVECVLGPLGS